MPYIRRVHKEYLYISDTWTLCAVFNWQSKYHLGVHLKMRLSSDEECFARVPSWLSWGLMSVSLPHHPFTLWQKTRTPYSSEGFIQPHTVYWAWRWIIPCNLFRFEELNLLILYTTVMQKTEHTNVFIVQLLVTEAWNRIIHRTHA